MIPRLLIALGLALALAAANWAILTREALLRDGQVLLLELAPVDPRSIMQGDYMTLDFQVARELREAAGDERPDGYVILRPDADGVGRFLRVQDASTPRAEDEIALRYRVRGWQVRLVTNAWFFEEGSAARFDASRYGEFRVADNGDALLVAMRDAQRQPIR